MRAWLILCRPNWRSPRPTRTRGGPVHRISSACMTSSCRWMSCYQVLSLRCTAWCLCYHSYMMCILCFLFCFCFVFFPHHHLLQLSRVWQSSPPCRVWRMTTPSKRRCPWRPWSTRPTGQCFCAWFSTCSASNNAAEIQTVQQVSYLQSQIHLRPDVKSISKLCSISHFHESFCSS